MRIVFAPDSFKGSLPAKEVAAALAVGWTSVRPDDDLIHLPQADGGEGTLDAIASCYPAAERRTVDSVTGPDGRSVSGEWLRLPDGTAVVELAQMNGLPLMARLDPGAASTTGLGEVIAAALRDGATSLVIGLGGSASTDGGAGALRALGARLLDGNGWSIDNGGAALRDLASIELDEMQDLPAGGVELLTDTRATLTGLSGAAHVFGAQKGAGRSMIAVLDSALTHFSVVLSGVTPSRPDEPGAGAAGGTGFGLAAWGGTLVPGARRIAELTGLSEEYGVADVIVTGEGRFDRTSLTGKLVGEILSSTRHSHTAVTVVAGQVAATPPCTAFSLTELAGSTEQAKRDPQTWLEKAGAAAALAVTAPAEAPL